MWIDFAPRCGNDRSVSSVQSVDGVRGVSASAGRRFRAWVSRTVIAVAISLGAGAIARAQPIIDDFSPKAGMPGDKILVQGSGFSVGSIKVYFWNGVLATVQVTSDTMLTATVPGGATTGALAVQRDSGSRVYTAAYFTVVGAGPYITDFSPTFGGSNTLVVINGVHFTGVAPSGVKFNGVAARDASANGAGTQINVHVPYGAPAGTGPITIITPAATAQKPTRNAPERCSCNIATAITVAEIGLRLM